MNTNDEQQLPDEELGDLKPAPKEPFKAEVENATFEVADGENIATGWEVWSADDNGFVEPEYFPAERNGMQVQGIRAEHRFDCALMQTLQTRTGLDVTVTMEFLVEPSPDEEKRGLERPEGIAVGLGIDPTGGREPRSDSVQWALRDVRYSEPALASVTATAQQDEVTVFARAVAFIPGSGLTLAELQALSCDRTCMRTAFDRTFMWLPKDASEALWVQVAKIARLQGWTMGGSADDAGAGAALLRSTTVKAVDATPLKVSELQDFFNKFYGDGVVHVEGVSV